MAAVTASADPVQGCSVTPLGNMRYRPMCSPGSADRWFVDGAAPDAVAGAPVVVFDRSDELQDRFLRQWAGKRCHGRRHYVPASADFAEAVRLGIGWAVLPRQQSERWESSAQLVDIAPGAGVDVMLYWQQWSVRTTALERLTTAVLAAAATELD